MSSTCRSIAGRVAFGLLSTALLASCGDQTPAGNIGGPRNAVAPAPAPAAVCSVPDQKSFVRGHLDDVYLWYSEIPAVDSNSVATPADYFYSLLVRSKDRFSFTLGQAEADALFQSGQNLSFGAEYVFDAQNRLRVAYSDPGSPAAQNGVERGDEIVTLNGSSIASLSNAQLNALLFPSVSGTTVTFGVRDVGLGSVRDVALAATTVTKTPVPLATVLTAADNKKVGYLVFNDHLATAEQPLIDAMSDFEAQGVQDLVLDLRYNGGGFLYIASQLARMIGGANLNGQVFESLRFNDKHPEKTNDPNNAYPFLDTSLAGNPLPQLGLSRVFVLIGPGTCSASESVINGLAPFVQVITIGKSTCGKPYGFIQKNYCGQAYFAIEFEGVNAAGSGGYTNGFAPTCPTNDDFDRALGDPTERLLAGALSYRATGDCSGVPTGIAKAQAARDTDRGIDAERAIASPTRGLRLLGR